MSRAEKFLEQIGGKRVSEPDGKPCDMKVNMVKGEAVWTESIDGVESQIKLFGSGLSGVDYHILYTVSFWAPGIYLTIHKGISTGLGRGTRVTSGEKCYTHIPTLKQGREQIFAALSKMLATLQAGGNLESLGFPGSDWSKDQ